MTEQDYQSLEDELVRYYRSAAILLTAADALFTPVKVEELINQLTLQPPKTAARLTIGYCRRQAPVRRVDLLLRLIRVLPNTQRLDEIRASLEIMEQDLARPQVPGVDPWDAVVLLNHLPFINRTSGRTVLKRLLGGSGQMIGCVQGPRRSGKSYTLYLVQHMADLQGDVRWTYVELEGSEAPGYEADDLAKAIVRRVTQNAQAALPDDLNPAPGRRVQQLAEWIMNTIAALPVRVWIVLDGFGHPDVAKPVQKLIEQLSGFVQKQLLGPGRRLILLDYPPRLLPTSVKVSVLEEVIPEPDQSIGEPELFEFFRRWLLEREPALGADPARLQGLAQGKAKGVLQYLSQTAKPDDVDRLTWINRQVAEAIAP
jgi:hypothetical protein